MFIVYVLENESLGKRYVGYTSDLERRMKEHNCRNRTKYTGRFDGKWEVCYTEALGTRAEAMKREKYLKSRSGRKLLNKLFDK